jgi:hypothetical protein
MGEANFLPFDFDMVITYLDAETIVIDTVSGQKKAA